jgi:dTDP-4-dehydrorhamnose 3,5-epimerase
MRFIDTGISGPVLLSQEKHHDERGFFARTWCTREFAEHGIDFSIVQRNLSFNRHEGTLRGLHFQAPPNAEGKLISCTHGSIFDVIVDIRPDSPTFLNSFSVVLSADDGQSLYAPPGFAHGFVTLTDNTQIDYLMSEFHEPSLAGGFRWNDPALKIEWPISEPAAISDRDATYADLNPDEFHAFRGI